MVEAEDALLGFVQVGPMAAVFLDKLRVTASLPRCEGDFSDIMKQPGGEGDALGFAQFTAQGGSSNGSYGRMPPQPFSGDWRRAVRRAELNCYILTARCFRMDTRAGSRSSLRESVEHRAHTSVLSTVAVTLVAGVVAATFTAIHSTSFAELIFGGPLTAFAAGSLPESRANCSEVMAHGCPSF
jgi:hypothetical protein